MYAHAPNFCIKSLKSERLPLPHRTPIPPHTQTSNFCSSYVYNLPLDWTDEQARHSGARVATGAFVLTFCQLKTLGLSIGALQRATVCVNRATGVSKGAASCKLCSFLT